MTKTYPPLTKSQALKILESLKEKADNSDKRMPSIVQIHRLLDYYKIKHWFFETTNVVERRSGNNRYVNSRSEGKSGYELKIDGLHMDTSNPYYSWNSWQYAGELVKIIEKVK